MEFTERKIYTVTELTEEIRKVLEGTFRSVWVQGEISNFKRAPSGHSYFTLKDDNSQVKCVLFKNQNRLLKFKLEDGLKVLAWGRVNVYTPRGEYQLVLETLEPVGLGSLMLALEQLKAKLTAEGLFDNSRKKPLPKRPQTVGVVTSATGAVVRDIIRIIKRRSPSVNILVSPTSVQGDRAPDEIVEALEKLVISGTPDVIIIGRGGGSIEDLWAFNDENVVRSVAFCPVPIVSAVGHETDFTLSDFAADVRASTPSAAAELVAPDDCEMWDAISQMVARLRNGITNCMTRNAQTLDELTRTFQSQTRRIHDERSKLQDLLARIKNASLRGIGSVRRELETMSGRLRPEILKRSLTNSADGLEQLIKRLNRSMKISVEERKSRLTSFVAQLDTLSPFKVLLRGYSITFNNQNGSVIREAKYVTQGDEIRTLVSDGEIISRVLNTGLTPVDSTIPDK